MRRGKIFALLAPLAILAVLLGYGPGAPVPRANSAESAAQSTLRAELASPSSACSPGYRALNMTNHCSFDVWFAEQPASAPGGTPQCPDPTNAMSDNFGCPTGTTCNTGGMCVTSCSEKNMVNAPDCGPNQTCVDGGFKQMASPSATPSPIYECFANYYTPVPVSTPTPSSGSGWDLAPGGQAVVCVPEASPSPSLGAPGASCTLNSQCQSYACESTTPATAGQFCLPGDSTCQCGNTITWSGNFWGRTGCTLSEDDQTLTCNTGACGTNIDCTTGPPAPATLSEMTLLTPSDPGSQDSYDISMVSGFNVGYSMQPVANTYSGTCGTPGVGCSFDINANCPTELQLTDPTDQRKLSAATLRIMLAAHRTQLCSIAPALSHFNAGRQQIVPMGIKARQRKR